MIYALVGRQEFLYWYEISLLCCLANDSAEGQWPAVLFAFQGSQQRLVGFQDNVVGVGRRAGPGRSQASANKAGEATSPGGDVCLISVRVGGAKAAEVGVEGWYACSVSGGSA